VFRGRRRRAALRKVVAINEYECVSDVRLSVTAHEVVFGPVGEPAVRKCAVKRGVGYAV
jgi:hypothetical protein